MTAYSKKISNFSMKQTYKKNTYDDKRSRDVMCDDLQRRFPNLDIRINGKYDFCDLAAYDKDGNLVCFFELDHTNSQTLHWPWYSILERKIESMNEMNQIAPVNMVWITSQLTQYRMLPLFLVPNWKNYPLKVIPYKKNEDIENLTHPDDFHIRIPFKDLKTNPIYTVGEY